jgi:hypothetical protein
MESVKMFFKKIVAKSKAQTNAANETSKMYYFFSLMR